MQRLETVVGWANQATRDVEHCGSAWISVRAIVAVVIRICGSSVGEHSQLYPLQCL